MASDYYNIVKEKSYMKIKMIILALMIVGSIGISGNLTKSKDIYLQEAFNKELRILAERVGS